MVKECRNNSVGSEAWLSACLRCGAAVWLWFGGYLLLQALLRPFLAAGIYPWLFAASGLLALLFSFRAPANRHALAGIWAAIIAATALAAVYFARLPETEWDSSAYHLPVILHLLEGWNPVNSHYNLLWGNYYPNGWPSLQAAFLYWAQQWLASTDSARALNLVLLLATGGVLAGALRAYVSRVASLLLCAALLLNPIVLSQLLTHKMDGTVYLASLALAAGYLRLAQANSGWKTDALLLFSAMTLLINSKLSGLYWAFCISAAAVILIALQQRRLPLRLIAVGLASGLTALLLVGYKPYVTTPLERGVLVYPPASTHLHKHYYPETAQQNQLERLGRHISLALPSDERRLPWQMHAEDWQSMAPQALWHDNFGVPFVLLGFAALLGALAAMTRPQPGAAASALAAAFLFLSIWCFPENWQLRFVPLLWVVPPLLCMLMLRCRLQGLQRCAWLLLALIAANGLQHGAASAREYHRAAKAQNRALTDALASLPDATPLVITEPKPHLRRKIHADKLWHRRLAARGVTAQLAAHDACRGRTILLEGLPALASSMVCY